MSVKINFNCHGKGRVRVVKVVRKPNNVHDVIQMNVQLLLEGDIMETSFINGDNSIVIPTDTCKNTVYCLAKLNTFNSIEDFGIIIARHFLTEYPQLVNKISIEIVEDAVWERLSVPDSNGNIAEHLHAFQRRGPCKPFTKVVGTKTRNTPISVSVESGFNNLDVLKTTQSSFENFHRDRFTSLPDVADRLVGTSVTANWSFDPKYVSRGIDFKQISKDIQNSLVKTFAGPADIGVPSPSVQLTLYEMGKCALDEVPFIEKIALFMPNIHNIPFPLETYGIKSADATGRPDIFYPIDEPHGMIKAEMVRSSGKAKL